MIYCLQESMVGLGDDNVGQQNNNITVEKQTDVAKCLTQENRHSNLKDEPQ